MHIFADTIIIQFEAVLLLLGWIWITFWSLASCMLIRNFYKHQIAPEHLLIEVKCRTYKLCTLNMCFGFFYMTLLTAILHLDQKSMIPLIASTIITMPTIYLLWFAIFKEKFVVLFLALLLILLSIIADVYFISQLSIEIKLQHEISVINIVAKCTFIGFFACILCAACPIVCF